MSLYMQVDKERGRYIAGRLDDIALGRTYDEKSLNRAFLLLSILGYDSDAALHAIAAFKAGNTRNMGHALQSAAIDIRIGIDAYMRYSDEPETDSEGAGYIFCAQRMDGSMQKGFWSNEMDAWTNFDQATRFDLSTGVLLTEILKNDNCLLSPAQAQRVSIAQRVVQQSQAEADAHSGIPTKPRMR